MPCNVIQFSFKVELYNLKFLHIAPTFSFSVNMSCFKNQNIRLLQNQQKPFSTAGCSSLPAVSKCTVITAAPEGNKWIR